MTDDLVKRLDKLVGYCVTWSEFFEYDMVCIGEAATHIQTQDKEINGLKWSRDSLAREVRILKDEIKGMKDER